eukprot:753861-Hanusia_phi.AAC.11
MGLWGGSSNQCAGKPEQAWEPECWASRVTPPGGPGARDGHPAFWFTLFDGLMSRYSDGSTHPTTSVPTSNEINTNGPMISHIFTHPI